MIMSSNYITVSEVKSMIEAVDNKKDFLPD